MLSGFAITQVGDAHIARGKGCEDHSTCKHFHSFALGTDVIISIVADGVGTCPLASVGSSVATESLATFLERALQSAAFFAILKSLAQNADEVVLKLIRHAFSYSIGKVEERACSDGNPPEWYDTTLTCTVFDGTNAWWGHAGDDGVVALTKSGEFRMVTHRHEGSDACSVVPLRERSSWEFGAEHDVASLALMTDGMLDYCVSSAALGNLVDVRFLQPLLYSIIESTTDLDETHDSWNELLWGSLETTKAYGFRVRDRVRDDLTLVLASSSSAVQSLPAFDVSLIDKYHNELHEKSQELQAALRMTANARFAEMARAGRAIESNQRSSQNE